MEVFQDVSLHLRPIELGLIEAIQVLTEILQDISIADIVGHSKDFLFTGSTCRKVGIVGLYKTFAYLRLVVQ